MISSRDVTMDVSKNFRLLFRLVVIALIILVKSSYQEGTCMLEEFDGGVITFFTEACVDEEGKFIIRKYSTDGISVPPHVSNGYYAYGNIEGGMGPSCFSTKSISRNQDDLELVVSYFARDRDGKSSIDVVVIDNTSGNKIQENTITLDSDSTWKTEKIPVKLDVINFVYKIEIIYRKGSPSTYLAIDYIQIKNNEEKDCKELVTTTVEPPTTTTELATTTTDNPTTTTDYTSTTTDFTSTTTDFTSTTTDFTSTTTDFTSTTTDFTSTTTDYTSTTTDFTSTPTDFTSTTSDYTSTTTDFTSTPTDYTSTTTDFTSTTTDYTSTTTDFTSTPTDFPSTTTDFTVTTTDFTSTPTDSTTIDFTGTTTDFTSTTTDFITTTTDFTTTDFTSTTTDSTTLSTDIVPTTTPYPITTTEEIPTTVIVVPPPVLAATTSLTVAIIVVSSICGVAVVAASIAFAMKWSRSRSKSSPQVVDEFQPYEIPRVEMQSKMMMYDGKMFVQTTQKPHAS